MSDYTKTKIQDSSINQSYSSQDGFKLCRSCFSNLPISNFGVSRSSPGGYHHICKVCRSQHNKHYRHKRFNSKEPQAEPIRSVRDQNLLILDQALKSKQFSCIGFIPHTDKVFKVVFGDSKYASGSIGIYSLDGTLHKVFEFGDLPDIKLQILAILKMDLIRLELTELDMINSKTIIYYL